MPLCSSSQLILLFSSILRHKEKGGGLPEEDAGVLMPGQRLDLHPPARARMTLQAYAYMCMRTHDCDAKICAGVLLCLDRREGAHTSICCRHRWRGQGAAPGHSKAVRGESRFHNGVMR